MPPPPSLQNIFRNARTKILDTEKVSEQVPSLLMSRINPPTLSGDGAAVRRARETKGKKPPVLRLCTTAEHDIIDVIHNF
ncbi:MAG: hypothetical protein A2759_01965 [Candidatus Taylorbacteria bacterium RIFCSPHIGHO2_01_FULL_49_60]|nr:MAG: hypothetical protein A2759_01965 [Candidatus Taylorbacteria bacterium RIFCSPHIGHO2_01_FULL_49_60]